MSDIEKPVGCRGPRRDRHVAPRQHVRIDKRQWVLAREAAKRDYGLGIGDFMGLLAKNWLRRRWPLDLGL